MFIGPFRVRGQTPLLVLESLSFQRCEIKRLFFPNVKSFFANKGPRVNFFRESARRRVVGRVQPGPHGSNAPPNVERPGERVPDSLPPRRAHEP